MYHTLQLEQYNFLKVDSFTSASGTLDQCGNDWHVIQEEQSLGKNHLSASKVPLAVATGINLDVQRTRLYFAYLRGWTSDHLFTASPSLSFAGDGRRELKGRSCPIILPSFWGKIGLILLQALPGSFAGHHVLLKTLFQPNCSIIYRGGTKCHDLPVLKKKDHKVHQKDNLHIHMTHD